MLENQWQKLVQNYDERRDIIIPGNEITTVAFCVVHFVALARESIEKQGFFSVALSGGNTPKAIFQHLSPESLDWDKVFFFWSDERAVPPTHPDSNYKTALDSALSRLRVPAEHIFRMPADAEDIEQGAKEYELLLKTKIPNQTLDLVMLGMGDDGHTASLFPLTHGLHSHDRWVIANYIPKKDSWRMSLTFDYINSSKNIAIYVLGASKAEMVAKVLTSPFDADHFPVQKIGTASHKALWILDEAAAKVLKSGTSSNSH